MNRFLNILFVGIIVVYCSVSANAQKPNLNFKHYSTSEGLSQNHVMAILQDSEGFMWFGTTEGLNRFNGYEFHIFKKNTKDTNAICNDNVGSILEDREGNIWLGTEGGLVRYNRKTNCFTNFVHKDTVPSSISAGMVNEIVEDRNGNLWLATANGVLDFFNKKTRKFIHYPNHTSDSSDHSLVEVTALLEDASGNIWVGTRNGIILIDSSHKIFSGFEHDPHTPGTLSNNYIKDIFKDSKGNIWVATNGGGLNLYNPKIKSFSAFRHDEKDTKTLAHDVVMCINEDKDGRLWIGTENGGLDVMDLNNHHFYHFIQSQSNKSSISDNSIYTIYQDKLKNMWIGTNSKGIDFYDRFMKPFYTYHSDPSNPTSLSHNKVLSVTEQPLKGIWIGTDGGGVNFLDHETGLFKQYKHHPQNPNSISSDFVVAVLWDFVDQQLWVATWGGGLNKLDPKTGKFKHYRHIDKDSTSIASDNLWSLHQDKEGNVYIGTIGSGFSIYNRSNDTFTSYSTPQGLTEDNVISLFKDKQGYLWLGTWGNGVDRMKLSTKEITHFNNTEKYPFNINSKSVFSITEDKWGKIWFSGSSGFNSYDFKSQRFRAYTTEDGLPGSMVNGALEDRKGNFWLSTNKGIIEFNPNQKTFNDFTVEDGLPTNQFGPRVFKASDGRMYFGSGEGLVTFHPDSIKYNPTVPKVFITDFQIFNKPVAIGPDSPLKQRIEITKEIWLTHQQSVFSFEFTALNYSDPEKNQYAYKMEGFDHNWNFDGHKRWATYTNLNPGTYTFKVKASNNDGIWNDKGVTLTIHILPPWWQTWWFRCIAGLAIAGIIVGYYISLKEQNLKLESQVIERTKELKVANNEIINKNRELVVQQEEINTQNEELQSANEELVQNQEEIAAQRDLLAQQNQELLKAQQIIEEQNRKITLHNQKLDQEVKERTKELVDYNHQLEQFAFIAAHNLRAPVARILGLGELLKFSVMTPEEEKMIMKKLIYTTEELDQVVKDISTILEIRKNGTPVISEINLSKQLAIIKDNLEGEILSTQTEIIEDFSRVNIIYTIKAYLDSILFNLIHNAIKYRNPDVRPLIYIKTEAYKEFICLSVSDNGLGIDLKHHKNNIFNLYKRFHTHIEGKGMGLYLVKTQVTALGGKIEVESKVNNGTTFKVYFKNREKES